MLPPCAEAFTADLTRYTEKGYPGQQFSYAAPVLRPRD